MGIRNTSRYFSESQVIYAAIHTHAETTTRGRMKKDLDTTQARHVGKQRAQAANAEMGMNICMICGEQVDNGGICRNDILYRRESVHSWIM